MQSLRNGDLPAWGRRAEGGGLAGGAAVALAENPLFYLNFYGAWPTGPVGTGQSLSACLNFIKAIKPPALLLNTEKVPPMR